MRFSKKKPPQTGEDLPSHSIPPLSEISDSPPIDVSPQNEPTQTTIGRRIKLIGELSGGEDILIEGTLEGNIHLKGHTVSIGIEGSVESNINAKSIVTEGSITGDVIAEDIITVKSGSHVHGNLKSNRVQLDEGAKFWGGIDIATSAASSNSPHSGA